MINPTDISSTMYSLQGKNLENIKDAALSSHKTKKDEQLMKAARDFEAVFVNQFLEIMDSTVEKSEFMHGGQAEDTFKSMLNQQIAQDISKNPKSSFGLAEQIYKQMKDKV